MIRYKEKAKDCQLIVKVRLPFGQSVSDNDLEFFARKCLRGFLRPKRVRSNTLEYVGPIAVPLYDRLKKPIRKYDFFFLIEQIVDATQKLQKNALPWNKVVWDLRHAYINETTKELVKKMLAEKIDVPIIMRIAELSRTDVERIEQTIE